MNNKYLDFAVTPYALPKVMLAFDNSGIYDYTVTQEDDDLHIRVRKDLIERVVYPRAKFEPQESEVPLTKEAHKCEKSN